MADAVITIGSDTSAVERAAQTAINSWRDASSTITGALAGVSRSLADVALHAGQVNFASQHEQVRQFEASTARMAVAMGRDFESVRSSIEATGHAIGRRPQEVANWATEVGRLTYNISGAAESIRGMSGLAAETGRSVDDYKGLAVEFGRAGVAGKDTATVIGQIAKQAEELGTVGGVAALADHFLLAGDAVTRFSKDAGVGISNVTGLIAQMTKGLTEAQAAKVSQGIGGIIGGFQNDPIKWERYLGHRILDKTGALNEKPEKLMQEVYDKVRKESGGNENMMRRKLLSTWDAPTAMAIMNTGQGGGFQTAGGVTGVSGAPAGAQAQYLGSDAGKRDVAAADLSSSARNLMGSSTKLGSAADALQKFASTNPILSTFAASAAGGLVSSGIGAATSSASSVAGAMGMNAAAVGSLAIAALPFVIGAAAAGAGVYGIKKFETAAEDRHRVEEKAADAASASGRELRSIANQRANKALRNVAGLSPEEAYEGRDALQHLLGTSDTSRALALSKGGDSATAALTGELVSKGESQENARRIAEAISTALRDMQINLQDASGTVTHTTKAMSTKPGKTGHQGN